MGERFDAWWDNVENFIMPMGRIVFKTCLMMFLISVVLATDSPWYAPLSPRGTFIFKFAVYLMFACFVYPELKTIFLYHKEAFSPENREKAKVAIQKIRGK